LIALVATELAVLVGVVGEEGRERLLAADCDCELLSVFILLTLKPKIVQNIIETNSKISLLIDVSTTNSSLPGMIINLKASISYDSPVFIFLNLIELKNLTSTNIIDQLLECLH